jgi:hypothetical protein
MTALTHLTRIIVCAAWLSALAAFSSQDVASAPSEKALPPPKDGIAANCPLSPDTSPELYELFRRSIGAEDHAIGAHGSSVSWREDLGLERLIEGATHVVIGTVERCEVRLDEAEPAVLTIAGNFVTPHTDYTVRVEEALKGGWKRGRVVVAEEYGVGRVALADGSWGEASGGISKASMSGANT